MPLFGEKLPSTSDIFEDAGDELLPWENWADGETWLVESHSELGMTPSKLARKLREHAAIHYKTLDVRIFGQAVAFRFRDLELPAAIAQNLHARRRMLSADSQQDS